ncbi:MAG: hypothetical protein ACK40L_19765, partial [Hydrogenophaga sp.]
LPLSPASDGAGSGSGSASKRGKATDRSGSGRSSGSDRRAKGWSSRSNSPTAAATRATQPHASRLSGQTQAVDPAAQFERAARLATRPMPFQLHTEQRVRRPSGGSTALAPAAEAEAETRGGGGRKRTTQHATVCARFREQLSALLRAISGTQPHFVRCIRSNQLQQAGVLDAVSVQSQLRYSGV